MAAGTVTITAVPPPGMTLSSTAASFQATVTLPTLPLYYDALSPLTVGKNLQTTASPSQDTVESLPLTVTSSDPSKVLVSLDGTQAGSASVSLTLRRSVQATVFVQGLADSGTVMLTWSSPGYLPRTQKVNLYPSGFAFGQGSFTTSLKLPVMTVVSPVLIGVGYRVEEPLRGGFGPVTVVLSSSAPGVGTLTPSTLTFSSGGGRQDVKFTPVAAGQRDADGGAAGRIHRSGLVVDRGGGAIAVRILFLFFAGGLLPLLAASTPFRDLFFEPNRGQAPAHARYIARRRARQCCSTTKAWRCASTARRRDRCGCGSMV